MRPREWCECIPEGDADLVIDKEAYDFDLASNAETVSHAVPYLSAVNDGTGSWSVRLMPDVFANGSSEQPLQSQASDRRIR